MLGALRAGALAKVWVRSQEGTGPGPPAVQWSPQRAELRAQVRMWVRLSLWVQVRMQVRLSLWVQVPASGVGQA